MALALVALASIVGISVGHVFRNITTRAARR